MRRFVWYPIGVMNDADAPNITVTRRAYGLRPSSAATRRAMGVRPTAVAVFDITAVSIHAYAYIQDRYILLPHGASMGEGYGPMVVAREACPLEELPSKLIAIPGTMTTAFLGLKLAIGNFKFRVVPFDRILDTVASGKADAGLIIHEGQLTYQNQGLTEIFNLGT